MLLQKSSQLLYELPIAAGGNSMTKCWKMEQMLVEHVPCMVKTDRVYCRIFIVIKVAQKVIGITYFHQIWLVNMVGIAVITHFCLIGFSNIQVFQCVSIYSRQFYQQFTNSLPIGVCSVYHLLCHAVCCTHGVGVPFIDATGVKLESHYPPSTTI